MLVQILVIIATIMLAGLGVMSMFAPNKMVNNFSLQPIGIAGLNALRSIVGGLFLGSVTMLIMAQTIG